jgi:hypothetical protein
VLFFVLAGVAPLTVAAGVIPTAYQATGLTGIPAAFVAVAVILALFAAGYVAMTRHITNSGAFYKAHMFARTCVRSRLLDYEAELAAIISAVNPARRTEGAYVEVLNWGSLAAIREALLARRYHVLHLSWHARPGELVLEDVARGRRPRT